MKRSLRARCSPGLPRWPQDGFLVSSEREAGEVKYVGLKSVYGKQATVINPWGTQQIRVRRTSDNATITTSSSAENAGAQPLIADRIAIGPWESFGLITN
ncbi:hypothetical protein AB0F17_33500 [Nonomuraea sp. NPDC026600]|uniref:hypothetical protein n=1 Tax=Nonomuraea sp. NPDC026600 TaxID=3155363 RepID=UPI00340F6EC9